MKVGDRVECIYERRIITAKVLEVDAHPMWGDILKLDTSEMSGADLPALWVPARNCRVIVL